MGNEAFKGKSFVLPKTNLKTLFLTWVFTRNRELLEGDETSLLNLSQDDETSFEEGTLRGPDGNWVPRSSGSALTTWQNEMVFVIQFRVSPLP